MRVTAARGRIALYGEFGTQNLGNEASLQVVIDQLRSRRPDGDLVVVGVHPQTVTADHAVPSFAMAAPRLPERRFRRLAVLVNRATKKLADPVWLTYRLGGYDALVVAGTGIVEDTNAMRAWQTPWSLLIAVAAARLRGAAVAFCAVGASPPTSRLKRRIFGTALRLATYRSYRDTYSRDAVAGMGVDTSADPITPDVCFALDRPDRVRRTGPRRRIGLGVMAYAGDDPAPDARRRARTRYVAAMTACAAHLVQQGHDVLLLIGESTDTAVADEVARAVDRIGPAAGRVSVHATHDMAGLLQVMAGLDLLVATRFHNIVGALHLGLPTAAVVYAPKTRVLMEAVGQGRWCLEAAEIDETNLVELTDRLLADLEAVQRQVEVGTGGYPAAVGRHFDALVGAVLDEPAAQPVGVGR